MCDNFDCYIGAGNRTEFTPDTSRTVKQLSIKITFDPDSLRHPKYLLGAGFYTELTSFTMIFIYDYRRHTKSFMSIGHSQGFSRDLFKGRTGYLILFFVIKSRIFVSAEIQRIGRFVSLETASDSFIPSITVSAVV